MALFLSTLVSTALFACLLLGNGSDALSVSISPSDTKEGSGKSVVITCEPDAGVDDNKQVKKLEIFKKGRKPIVSIDENSNIKYGQARYRSKSRINGYIDTSGLRSWMKLTLTGIAQKDAGEYRCIMHYAVTGSVIKKDTAIGHLTVLREMDSEILRRLDKIDSEILPRLDSLENQTKSSKNSNGKGSYPVAFSATPDEYLNVYKGDVIVYNKVTFRIGDGYDEKKGTFTSPNSCLYVFYFSAYMGCTGCYIDVDFMVNDVMKGSLGIGDKYYYTSNAASFVVPLQKGDVVKLVPSGAYYSPKIKGRVSSMFSGYCIKAT